MKRQNQETFDKVQNAKNSSMAVLEHYSIVKTGGKQYFLIEGKTIEIEKIQGNPGDTISFDEVLLRRKSSNDLEIGQPFLETPAKGVIVKHMRDKKIIVFKFKRRKKYRTKKGHRQFKTIVRVTSI